MPIGGAYRLIDVPMSNCINSGISKIYILTQFNSTSLNRHLARTYNMGSGVRFGGEGFVEVLAATQVGGREGEKVGRNRHSEQEKESESGKERQLEALCMGV